MLKRMMKTLPLILLSLMLVQSASAQRRGDQPGHRGRGPAHLDSTQIVQMVDKLAQELTLSQDQQSGILQLWLDHVEAVKAQLAENQGDREAMRTAMDELRQLLDEGIKALLTEEQQAAYDKLQEKRQEQRERGGRGRRGRSGNGIG